MILGDYFSCLTDEIQGNVDIPKSKVPGVKITLMSVQVERAVLVTELDRWVGGVTILGSLE